MITKELADKIIALKLSNRAKMSIDEIKEIIIDHMKYLVSNYNDLDDELKTICDNYLEQLFTSAEENSLNLPEVLNKLKS